ncbi:hypothetical protein T265_09375 [Opisthorchis viverrini]|uniref:Uncharacterized protein n=1 Tax=Opisthorchis viverrini TaxID=6198 RepID=A0A074Z676_OPIVI|nr:hypothetical protein T265_09375 [Opisthorchis viverrini]KER22578.1 hypothetical protein T265_09375 [Opisthorchis viverrini]
MKQLLCVLLGWSICSEEGENDLISIWISAYGFVASRCVGGGTAEEDHGSVIRGRDEQSSVLLCGEVSAFHYTSPTSGRSTNQRLQDSYAQDAGVV